MALIVEDGTGKTDADAYADLTYVDGYHVAIGTPAADWADLTDTVKEQKVRNSTKWMDETFRRRWKGTRKTKLQARDWPRVNVQDSDGYWLDSDSLPAPVPEGMAAIAPYIDDIAEGTVEDGRIKSESNRFGPMSESVTYVDGKRKDAKRFPRISRILGDLLRNAGRIRLNG